MKQEAFTVLTEVDPERVEALRTLLNSIGDDIRGNPHLRFERLRDLHYACFAIIPGPDGTSMLLFEGNVDGRVHAFWSQLVAVAGDAVDEIYAHCVGYPAVARTLPERVVAYLAAHDAGSETFYVAWPGWTVDEIRREHGLRERIEDLLDTEDAALRPLAPAAVRARIQDVVARDPALHWASTPHPRPFLVVHGRRVLRALLAPPVLALVAVVRTALTGAGGPGRARLARLAVVGVVGALGATAASLRRAERADEAADAARDEDWATTYARWSENLPAIVAREDVQVQNHMVSVTDIKPGRLRFVLLRAVLWVIDVLARLSANRGRLGGIASIHFARWVITPDRRRLIFLSNFDGSWERYLSDFIDRAATGLTAVWSNTDNAVGFPATRWLTRGGARDEVRFKAYSRYSMVPTNVWYSAYPDLTVADIANRMEVRRRLFGALDPEATGAWLRRF